jgi:hypothetical protein
MVTLCPGNGVVVLIETLGPGPNGYVGQSAGIAGAAAAENAVAEAIAGAARTTAVVPRTRATSA